MDYEIREVREGDLSYLGNNLRDDDKKELFAVSGHDNYAKMLELSVAASDEVLVGSRIGQPAGVIWGIVEYSDKSAMVWALATDHILDFRVPFLKTSLQTIARWFKERPETTHLFNFVHVDNEMHIRWLKWLGADIMPAVEFGAERQMFHPFTIKREKYRV